jgi:hypothetical protein
MTALPIDARARRNLRQGALRGGTLAERGVDLHETPPCAVAALLRVERIEGPVWEPVAGRGAVVSVLRAAGIAVVASDIATRPDADPAITPGIDFFAQRQAPPGCRTILTNPPFLCADRFVRHALTLVPDVIVLERLAWLESAKRIDLFQYLYRVHVGIERLPKMHRDGWAGRKLKTETAPFGWYAFRQESRPAGTPIALDRISWRSP